MFFKKKEYLYTESTEILQKEGYSQNYINSLQKALQKAGELDEINEGTSFLASAYLFTGDLYKAADTFSQVNIDYVPEAIRCAHISNYLLTLFLQNRYPKCEEIFLEYNRYALSDSGLFMRRSMGIHQFATQNYDAAATIFLKALKLADKNKKTYMLDICLVKTLNKLEMYSDAMKYTTNFHIYGGMGRITTIANSLRKTAKENSSKKK